MTLNGHFTLNFHYYEPRFQQLGYILIVELFIEYFLLYDITSRDVWKRTVILIAFPLTRKYMTLNDLTWHWPFYVKFSLLRTAL